MDETKLNAIVERYRPDFAMAYGSGVFPQNGYSKTDRPMVDFVFGVSDPSSWHENNVSQNPKDYAASMRMLPPTVIVRIQKCGPGIFYNPFVKFEDWTIKYGVISLDVLKQDLTEWQTLYVAGRLHKPSKILKASPEIITAQGINLESALNSATLLLPEKFTRRELYETIASLSYLGDSRMHFAENRNKVSNIVDTNLKRFEEVYAEAISRAEWLVSLQDEQFAQDVARKTLEARLRSLPFNLRRNIPASTDIEDIYALAPELKRAIREITILPSIMQSLKGFLTAGPIGSARYLTAKLRKAWK